jgi:hypothetical protein
MYHVGPPPLKEFQFLHSLKQARAQSFREAIGQIFVGDLVSTFPESTTVAKMDGSWWKQLLL